MKGPGLYYKLLAYSKLINAGRKYKPQPLTWHCLGMWFSQFPRTDWPLLWKLLRNLKFISEAEVVERLVKGNKKIIERIREDGLTLEQIIYIQIHDAGSSSGVLLNALRDAAGLENCGVHMIDASSRALASLTSAIGEGAIIYVDDFAGTGQQFTSVREAIGPYIIGQFAEHFLTACITEEAEGRIEQQGVQSTSGETHLIKERPLRQESPILNEGEREQLLTLSRKLDRKFSLGYRNLGTMVVFHRQCPNTVPLLVRGSKGQAPYVGIFPRADDRPRATFDTLTAP